MFYLYTKFQSSSYFIVFIMNFLKFSSAAILKMAAILKFFFHLHNSFKALAILLGLMNYFMAAIYKNGAGQTIFVLLWFFNFRFWKAPLEWFS